MKAEEPFYSEELHLAMQALRRSLERERKLRGALQKFLTKYDALEPALANAFLMEQIRGRPYKGDNWSTELAELRALAAEPEKE